MSKECITYKDLEFEMDNVSRVIKNVPVTKRNDYPGEYELDTALKLGMIRDLMKLNEIPNEIDFKDVEGFEI